MKSKRWKVEKWRNEEKKKNCKDMEDCSMVENENESENEEMGQHVLLVQVFLELY